MCEPSLTHLHQAKGPGSHKCGHHNLVLLELIQRRDDWPILLYAVVEGGAGGRQRGEEGNEGREKEGRMKVREEEGEGGGR